MVAEKAMIGLDIFLANMEPEDISEYLNELVPMFIQVVLNNDSTFRMKQISLESIGYFN